MKPIIIVHHHEITLKGGNRGFFERQLLNNVRHALSGLVEANAVRGGYGKFIIDIEETSSQEVIIQRLTKVFGLSNICAGVQVGQSVEVFCQTAQELLRNQQFKTIKVDTRRPDHNFPIGSMEVNAKVGEHLCKTFNVRANLTNPDETIFIEIVDGAAYVYRSKIQGAGGLPVGVSGKVVGLLSAGFDSPVACWKMMKRGANVIFVHFHSMPYTSQNSVDQVKQLTDVLTSYQFKSTLYLVPFAELQQEIVVKAPQALRVILYRRMMIRIAQLIAEREKAEALVTGEAVGQVASQTLRNIRAIDEVAALPILRPLSGDDKEETIAVARRIGTYDISKEPYDDCCSFLAPRKPETWADLYRVRDAEANLVVSALVDQAMQKSEIVYFLYRHVKRETLVDTSVH